MPFSFATYKCTISAVDLWRCLDSRDLPQVSDIFQMKNFTTDSSFHYSKIKNEYPYTFCGVKNKYMDVL